MELFAPRHLLIILAICLLVFGTKKLKTIGADLGGALKGFKQAMKEGESCRRGAHRPPAPLQSAALETHDAKAPAEVDRAARRLRAVLALSFSRTNFFFNRHRLCDHGQSGGASRICSSHSRA